MCAIMIPSVLRDEDYEFESREDLIFNSLRDHLPNNYYVFHSVRSTFPIQTSRKAISRDKEADFVIFNPAKKNGGIIVVEAKYISGFNIDNGRWMTDTGKEIHHGSGPYNQVLEYVNSLKGFIVDNLPSIKDIFPISYIVWFHKMGKEKLNGYPNINDTNLLHTFSMQDLENPLPKIEKILNEQALKNPAGQRDLTDFEIKKLQALINANANVFDAAANKKGVERDFRSLLDEQIRILDFLEDQPLACIQGLGGTGKTVVAIKKAQRDALDGETLFLCYNSALKEHLAKAYKNDSIDFYTLDGLKAYAGTLKGSKNPTYSDLNDFVISDDFPYKHVVIDEAQDFGRDQGANVDSAKLVNEFFDWLKEIIIEKRQGSLFIFFDRYQCVQSSLDLLPDVIKNPDCLLTLHTNCRNTKEIGSTSLGPLKQCYGIKTRTKILKGVSGPKPSFIKIRNEQDLKSRVDSKIKQALSQSFEAVILTLKTLETTSLAGLPEYTQGNDSATYMYSRDGETAKIKVSTVRKFKGLEADAVILIDVSEETFAKNDGNASNQALMNFYVGCSRARQLLSILASINEERLEKILTDDYQRGVTSKPIRDLVTVLEAKFE